MTPISKEELLKYKHHLTAGDIKKFIEKHNVPDTALVLIQRVDDHYFEGGVDISGMSSTEGILPPGSRSNEWEVYLKRGENWWYADKWNRDVESGEYLDKEKYPNMKPENLKKYTEEEMVKFMERYYPAWCCVKYSDDDDILFIDIHY
jgi:hypothetical protein